MSEELVRRVEAEIKEAIKHREKWRELDIAAPSLRLLKDEIAERLRGLGIYDEPSIEVTASYRARLAGSEPEVRMWISLPKHNISCLVMYKAEAIAIDASQDLVLASVKRDEASDIVVQCWRKRS